MDLSDLYDKQVTLEELTNSIIAKLSNEYDQSEFPGISYAYIDCGMDGTPELIFNISVHNSDYWTKTFIIKDFNGELKTVYSNLTWSRSNAIYNEYGYINADGSGGAAVHVYDKSYVDGNGNYHFIYSDTSTTGLDQSGQIYVNGGSLAVPSDCLDDSNYAFIELDLDTDESTPSIYSFVHYQDGSYEDSPSGFSSYFYCTPDKDDSYYQAGNAIYDFFTENGVEIVPISTIDQMIADKEAAEGLTEEIKNGAPVEWQELHVNFQPVIPGLDTDNFLGRMEHFPIAIGNAKHLTTTTFRFYADGSVEGSYHYFDSVDNGDNTSEKNNFTGTLEVTNKVNDNVFELKMTNFTLENEPGSTTEYKAAGGYKTYVTFTEIPGLEDHEATFILYCPGASKDEIDPRVIEALPERKMDQFEDGILDEYLLLCTSEDYSVWCALSV